MHCNFYGFYNIRLNACSCMLLGQLFIGNVCTYFVISNLIFLLLSTQVYSFAERDILITYRLIE